MTDPAAIRLVVPAEPAAIRLLVPGPAGPAGGSTLTRFAATVISGHRVIKASGDLLASYPDLAQPLDAELILGVSTGAASAGAAVAIQTIDELVEPSWSWSLGPVFCGPAGVLVQAPPFGAAWVRQVGVAVAPDRLLIQLRPPILTPEGSR